MKMKVFTCIVLPMVVIVIAASLATLARKEAVAQSSQDVVLDYDAYKKKEFSNEQKARNRRFNRNVASAPRHRIEELPANARLEMTFGHWWVELSALPIEQAEAVVIGTVTNREAHLSEDETSLFTEYQVKIEQILKDVGQTLETGTVGSFMRHGGGVRFKSGKVQEYRTYYQGVPRQNGRYLFFLKRENGVDFFILTGYQLSNGKVTPLDGDIGSGRNGGLKFEKYLGADEDTLLRQTKAAIDAEQLGESPR